MKTNYWFNQKISRRPALAGLLIPLLLTCFALSPAALAQDTIVDVLGGHQWLVRSASLGPGVSLAAAFNPDGNFTGSINAPPGGLFIRSQEVTGAWYFTGGVLFLQWNWIEGKGPFASQRYNEVPIEIRSISASKVVGIDRWGTLWNFQRIKN
jgi:hypothetical protein